MIFNAPDEQIEKIKTWLGTGSINIFGPPFSGKDFQGRRLGQLFDAPLISGGEILRSGAKTPKNVLDAIDVGGLAPMKQYLEIIAPYLSRPAYKDKPLILDSVGRWHGEEQVIIDCANKAKHPLKAVVLLQIDEPTVSQRWQIAKQKADRGFRADDAQEYLQTRIKEYQTKTLPVIDFYKQKNLLIEVDGALPPDQVTTEIIKGLVDFSSN